MHAKMRVRPKATPSGSRRFSILRAILIPITAAWVAMGTAPPIHAQELPEPRTRVLNGHHFIPSSNLSDPFILTWVRQTTGVGSAQNVTTTIEDVDSTDVSFSGDVTFVGLDFGFQQAFNDWFAAFVIAGGGGRIGTDASTILTTGVNAIFDFTLGGKFRLWRNRNFFLAGSIDYTNSGVSGVDIIGWARNVVETGEFSDSALVSKKSTGNFRGGLNMSYAPAPWIGITALTLFGIGNAVGDLDSEFAFAGQLFTDIDLKPITPVPVGFLLGVDRNTFSQQGGDITQSINTFNFGIFYTGRDDFSIGLESQTSKIPIPGLDENVTSSRGSINIKYWF